MRNRDNRIDCYLFSVMALLIASCNLTKNVPKGDALYTGATIKVKDSTLSKKEKNKIADFTEHLPRPKPNSKFLGIPFKLIIYNLSGDPKKNGFIRKFLRRLGQPPVLLSSVNLDYNVKVLKNTLENVGYFRTDASGDTSVKNKKAHATYTLEPGPVYTINEVNFVTDSSALGRAILQTKSKTLLQPKDPFNLEVIKGERLRIDAILKEEGYYFFSPDLLIINADTAQGDHQVKMYLMVKENTTDISKKPYIIDDVYIYPNYRLNTASADTAGNSAKLFQGYYIVDPRKRFKPKLFRRILRFDSGDVYNRKDHNLTLSRLINLDVFKFVKNRFELSSNSQGDTGRLNTYYYLTPLRRKSLRAEVSGNSRDNNPGSNITLSWLHRNLLKGAEHLTIHAYAGTEIQYSASIHGNSNTYRAGGGFTFTTPRFVVPFFKFNTTSAYVPRSKIELGYDLLNRSKLYTLNSFTAELGYVWKPTQITEHQFNLFSINYVLPLNVTQVYRNGIGNNPILQHAIDTQFILGTNYSITVDHLVNNPKGSGWYLSLLGDVSGNTAGLVAPANSVKGKKTIIGVPFDQYFKGQADVRYYYALNTKSRLANRIIAGFGYPYGNSRQLPFIKQFFIGGNNSLRGFRSRSVGPGTYRDPYNDSTSFFPDESGDIKLELNTEFRFKVNDILEPAIFVDAGNIWLYNKDTTTLRSIPGVLARPGVQFTKNFLNELAVDAGIGLRIDLSILLLRLDIAVPLRKPWLPPGQRWVFSDVNLRNAVFNLAIGYPF